MKCKHNLKQYRKKMQTTYPLKVQAIRSQGKQPRLFVTFPLALARIFHSPPGFSRFGGFFGDKSGWAAQFFPSGH